MTGFKFQISLVVVVFVEVSAGSNRRVLQLREADVERWSGGGETDVNTERQRDHLRQSWNSRNQGRLNLDIGWGIIYL